MVPMADITERGDIGSGQVLGSICWFMWGTLSRREAELLVCTQKGSWLCQNTCGPFMRRESSNHPRIVTKLGCRDHVNVFSSVQSLSHVRLFVTPWTAARQPPFPSPTPRVHPNPCPLSWWCHSTISSSVVPFSSCPQSCPASGSFPTSQLFTSGGQSIGVSASTSVLPMNTQDWSLEWTDWISLQSKGLSRIFSNTTVHIGD